MMADGSTKPIEQVELGDEVLVTEPGTRETTTNSVVATWVHPGENQRTTLTVRAPGMVVQATSEITATNWHPIWSVDAQDWIAIGEVRPGMHLRSSNGGAVQVVDARPVRGAGVVHDLTVNDVHTYDVLAGLTPVLVHNRNRFDWRNMDEDELDDFMSQNPSREKMTRGNNEHYSRRVKAVAKETGVDRCDLSQAIHDAKDGIDDNPNLSLDELRELADGCD